MESRNIDKKIFLWTLLIASIAVSVYANSLGNAFVFDDLAFIVKNDFIKDWNNLKIFFTSDYLKLTPSAADPQRPVMTISLILDYLVWGLNPKGFHLTNIILHAINSIAVLYLLHALTCGKLIVSVVTAVAFAIHPIHSEAVNCISFREDLLVTFFYLGAIILFLRGIRRPVGKKSFLAASAVFYLLSLLSKEMALTIPLAILLVHISTEKSLAVVVKEKWFYATLFAISIIYLAFLLFFIGSLEQSLRGMHGVGKFSLNFPIISGILFYYLRLAIFPVNLNAAHDFPRYASFLEINALMSAAVIVAIFLIGLYFIKRRPLLSIFVCWFFITILPVSGIVPIIDPVAERYLYLPSIGPIALIGLMIGNIWRTRKSSYALAASIFLLILLVPLTFKRNEIWREDYSLWKDVVKRTPWNYLGHQSLAMAAYRKGNTDEAISALKEALELKPNAAISSEIYYDLGLIYRAKGMDALAIEALRNAASLNSNDIRIIYSLSAILKEQDR